MKEPRNNFSHPDIVSSHSYMYACTNPSAIDDIIGQLMVNEENVRDLSKPVQTPKSDETIKMVRPKAKTIVDKSIESLLNESQPSFSKQIELHSPSVYGSVQSQPMQLTLSHNKTEESTDKNRSKNNTVGLEKEYSYILDMWPDSVRAKTGEDPTQTEPLQLTSVTKPGTVRKPKQRKDAAMNTKKKKDDKEVCQVCQKKFSTVGSVREHMRLHTGEKPFKCDECGSAFATKSNLTTHKRMHTGEKPFMCGICQKVFSQSTHLSAHAKTHNREPSTFFKCDECGKLLRSKITLSNHMKNHTGDRPFVCEICGSRFACKAYLSDHYMVHSNERPYQCDVCKKSFKEKSYVTIHKKKFCGNNGYIKRWQEEGVKKPPGRKRTARSTKLNGSKRLRGRPRSRKKKKFKKKLVVQQETESDVEFEDLIGENEAEKSANAVEAELPLALTNGQEKQLPENTKSQENRNDEDIIDDYNLINLSSHQDTSEQQDLHKADNCPEETFLDIHLTDDVILDFTKPGNLNLSNCFSEPQNLTLSANGLTQSHCLRSSNQIDSFQLSGTNAVHESDHNFPQPQNLCLPQNLCINQSNCQSPVQPQNLSLPSKIQHNLTWDINSLQEDNLSQPQNLSMPQNLTPKPQNLSQSRGNYQNMSHSNNMNGQTLNQNQMHSLGNLAHNTLTTQTLSHHALGNPTFGSPHDFAQPQNLSQSHISEDSSMQPQNLSVPHNMTFTNMPQAMSVPHNLSMSHNMQALANIQPQNLTQSHLTNSMQSLDLPSSSSLQVLYYS